ncbi:MAG: S8 family peptidase [Actinobacteria bacterium]|nr:S8 family peptidase [Actinomycetota bacterium]
MRIAAKLADVISKKAPDKKVHVIVKSRLLEKDIIEELMRRPMLSIRHIIKMAKAVSLAIPAGQVEALAREPWVEKIEEDEKVYVVIDGSVALADVQAVHETGFTGKGVKLAIIDTGIDGTHPDFADRVVAIRDFTLEGFKDGNGHGSHVAGIAAGSGAYSGGRFIGIAPDALIISGKALKSNGSGRMSDVMAAIEWAVDLSADIVNLSIGASGSSDGNDALCEICDAAVEAGVVVCVAAGNSGPGRRTIGSPGAARRVITVGAATASGLVAEFSSRGPTIDERLKPEIVAPGVDIVSARAKNTRAGKALDNYYTSATGTSMATSHVSGIIALLLEADRDASPQLVREALLHTANDLELGDCVQGAGMVMADAALRYIQTHENPPEPIDQSPPRSACLSLIADVYEAFTKREQKKGERRRAYIPPTLDDIEE